jgi:hypothetical protein
MAGELITGSKAVKDELEALLRKIEFGIKGGSQSARLPWKKHEISPL